MNTKRILLAGLGLGCGLALLPAKAPADKLVAVTASGGVADPNPPTASAPETLFDSAISNPTTVLATADGTDLIVAGHNGTDQLLRRIGRTGGALGDDLDYPSSPLNVMDAPVLVRPGVASNVGIAFIGNSWRHLAAIVGTSGAPQVQIYDPIPRRPMPSAPEDLVAAGTMGTPAVPGWTTTVYNLAGTGVAGLSLLTSAGPRQLFAASPVFSPTMRVVRIAADAAPVVCPIQSMNAGDMPTITAITGVPAGPGEERTDVLVATSDGAVVRVSRDCTAATTFYEPPSTPLAPFTGLAASATPSLLFGSAPGRVAAFTLGGGLSPLGGALEVPDLPGGAAATSVNGGRMLTAGVLGYQLYDVTTGAGAASFTAVGTAGVTPSNAAGNLATPAFLLSDRNVTFDGTGSMMGTMTPGRLGLIEVTASAGHPFQLFIGGCRSTSVFRGKRPGGVGPATLEMTSLIPGGAGPPSEATPISFNFLPLAPGAGDTLVLAFSQGGVGEDCTMMLASDPALVAGRGGGALIRLAGRGLGQRAIALVLDKSGSMDFPLRPELPADPSGNPVRRDILKNAVLALSSLVSQLPDARSTQFGLVAFSDLGTQVPGGPILGGSLETTVTPLLDFASNGTFRPGGWTNIRGGVKAATDWFDANTPTATNRTIILVTDGEHNRVGSGGINTAPAVFDDVNCLEPTSPPSVACPGTPAPLSTYLTGTAGVARLYAIGLSEASRHPSLPRLVQNVNGAASSGSGYLNYADSAAELPLFLHKALWNVVGATSVSDPVVVLNLNPRLVSSARVSVRRTDEALLMSLVWNDASRPATVDIYAVDPNTGAERFFANATQLDTECRTRSTYLTCVFNANSKVFAAGELRFEARRTGETPGSVQAMFEVAARSAVHLRASLGRSLYGSGDRLVARVRLSEFGLPLRGPATVLASVERPTAGLGTVLANATVDPAQIAKMAADPKNDTGRSGAKLRLLPAGMRPGTMRQENVPFHDDGKDGDTVAGDGIYSALIDAPVPGSYVVQARAVLDAPVGGKAMVREATATAQVVVRFDGKLSLQGTPTYTPGKDGRGALSLRVKPVDSKGNLLGPGAGNELVFRQRGRTLPAQVTEPETLDGSYDVSVQEVEAGTPVYLVGASGATALYVPGVEPPPVCDGCCCDLSRRGAAPGRSGVFAGLIALALLLGGARRRLRR